MVAVPSMGRASEIEGTPNPRERAAAGELYARHSDRIYRYCLRRLRSREEAEDATQITFLNAFRGLQRGVTPELEQAWLYKIAENVCLSRVRSNVRRLRVESPTDLEPLHEVVAAPSGEPIDVERMQEALARLPEQQRRAILFREWQGLSYREIAGELGVSQGAVETLIFRARRSLAKALREQDESGSRLRKGANLGSLLAWIKSIAFGGSAAIKVAAIVAAGTAVIAAGSVGQTPKTPVATATPPAKTVGLTAAAAHLRPPAIPMTAPAPRATAPVRHSKTVGRSANIAATAAPDRRTWAQHVPSEPAESTPNRLTPKPDAVPAPAKAPKAKAMPPAHEEEARPAKKPKPATPEAQQPPAHPAPPHTTLPPTARENPAADPSGDTPGQAKGKPKKS